MNTITHVDAWWELRSFIEVRLGSLRIEGTDAQRRELYSILEHMDKLGARIRGDAEKKA